MDNLYIVSNLWINQDSSGRGVRSRFSLPTLGFVKAAISSKYRFQFLEFEKLITKLVIVN